MENEKQANRNELLDIIENDTTIPPQKVMQYLSLANIFMEDFAENLTLTSLDLNEVENVGVNTWREFLNHPSIRQYLDLFRNEQIESKAMKDLLAGEGVKDALNIRKMMKEENRQDNSNFIIMLLPGKEDDLHE